MGIKQMLQVLAVLLAEGFEQGRVPQHCLTFQSQSRLPAGKAFATPVPDGLEFRLVPDRDYGWSITVVDPSRPQVDYLWVVSPPYQTAPQRQIGAGYNHTARQSASMPRELFYVLSAEDHKTMFDLLAVRPAPPGHTRAIIEARERLRKGRLLLNITSFEGDDDALDWITFTGEACAPR